MGRGRGLLWRRGHDGVRVEHVCARDGALPRGAGHGAGGDRPRGGDGPAARDRGSAAPGVCGGGVQGDAALAPGRAARGAAPRDEGGRVRGVHDPRGRDGRGEHLGDEPLAGGLGRVQA